MISIYNESSTKRIQNAELKYNEDLILYLNSIGISPSGLNEQDFNDLLELFRSFSFFKQRMNDIEEQDFSNPLWNLLHNDFKLQMDEAKRLLDEKISCIQGKQRTAL